MSNWLDFRLIKREADLESVLRHYGVELRRSGKDQYRGRCPIHRGEGRDAFHANTARNVFYCFACGAGGTVLDFIADMERCSLYEAAEKLETMISSFGLSRPAAKEKELVTERRKVSSPLAFSLRGIDCAHPYLAERGISKETALTFGVGFYTGPGLMQRRLVFPIHNVAGELIAYCGRSVDQTQPRYRVPPGFAKSEVLFNLHRAAATEETSVVTVEGFFDCMKVHQAGGSADGSRALRTTMLRSARSFPASHPDARRRRCWPKSNQDHSRETPTTMPDTCRRVALRRPARSVVGARDPRDPGSSNAATISASVTFLNEAIR